MARDEAVLRFPYDEGLRQLLRAIPGRRWDPARARLVRAARSPSQAEALARLFAGLAATHRRSSDELERAIGRRRARRRRDECLVDLARPDEDWWLSFATDGPAEPVARLLEHPDARELPAIGRALVPLDDRAAALLGEARATQRRAAPERRRRGARCVRSRERRATSGAAALASATHARRAAAYDVEFRRDRRGEHWILIASERARARARARRAGGPARARGPGRRRSAWRRSSTTPSASRSCSSSSRTRPSTRA